MSNVIKLEGRIQGSDEHVAEKDLIIVGKIIRYVDKKECEVELVIRDLVMGKNVTEIVNRNDITPKNIKRLMLKNGGVCLRPKKLVEAIEAKVNSLLLKNGLDGINDEFIRYRHDKMGWQTMGGNINFFAESIYSKTGMIESEYVGEYKIQAQGSLHNIIDSNFALELAPMHLENSIITGIKIA